MLKPTEEQDAIIASDAPVICVEARAGTGKTSTLVQYALARPREKMLYLAFNRSIRDEAASRFPKNVKVMTSHGVAFGKVGLEFSRNNKLTPSVRMYDILTHMNRGDRDSLPRNFLMLYATMVKDCIERFICSGDEAFTEDHACISDVPAARLFKVSDIVRHAKSHWEKMQDPGEHGVGMTHDGYLKLFMLNGYKIDGYDRILFDEAQDANPSAIAIVRDQECSKVWVGDPYQNIYGFRGSVNAMSMLGDGVTFPLLESFRFGQEIAGCANTILAIREAEKFLVGRGAPGKILPGSNCTSRHAFISRSNMTLLLAAADNLKAGKKMHFVGGLETYRFTQIMDVYALAYGGKINDPLIASFSDMTGLEDYADSANDHDILIKIAIIKKYGKDITLLLDAIACSQAIMKEADVIMTTAHRAKGLQFDTVVLSEDFRYRMKSESMVLSAPDETHRYGLMRPELPEELNLAYVAITRAMHVLFEPEWLSQIRNNPMISSITRSQVSVNRKIILENLVDDSKRRIKSL